MVTSGIRIGTPAVTTRGLKEEEMRMIARWIDRVLSNIHDEHVIQTVRNEVITLMKQFPLPYPSILTHETS
jgi:glycine hydroxymethyltransferase